MPDGASHLDDVGSVVEALSDLGLHPVLVGGMALVVIGSRRVTSAPGDAEDIAFLEARLASEG